MSARRLTEYRERLQAIRQDAPFSLELTLAEAVDGLIAGHIGGTAQSIAKDHILPQVRSDLERLDTAHAALWKQWAIFAGVMEASKGRIVDLRSARQHAQFALTCVLLAPIVVFLTASWITDDSSDGSAPTIASVLVFLITFCWWLGAGTQFRRGKEQGLMEAGLGPQSDEALSQFEAVWSDSRQSMHEFAAKLRGLIDHALTLRPVRKALARDRVADAEANLVNARYQVSLAQKSLADAQAKHIRAMGVDDRRQAQQRFDSAAYWNVSKEQDVARCEAELRIAIVDYESV
ncbi:MAG: hypothetical protein U1E18_29960 [Brevundimonas sp.]|uniref:hypothetical protein n=1 Tax=Brevundimonas sp. TaxID=1871086 RepID=UPI002ABD0353|nr:hypothetical protein [Brevundimonas sp.]MDZ4113795.1 hypothetical protein [Brevundimonas sp.]